ncbi:hypothetical protein LEP1GSC162_1343 [Leptospira santarosai str. CBC1531]|nr:hypothetical protein LEP1GSC162_1343 [Leptospira santarosai str. CBC1531]
MRSVFRFPITEMAALSGSSPLEDGFCSGCERTSQESRKKRKIQKGRVDFCSIWLLILKMILNICRWLLESRENGVKLPSWVEKFRNQSKENGVCL